MERRIGIDASDAEIRASLRACFGLRNPRRAFWLEDEAGTVRVISREMHATGLLNLVLDPGPGCDCAFWGGGGFGGGLVGGGLGNSMGFFWIFTLELFFFRH